MATITLTVAPINDAPVANEDSASTNEDTPVTVAVLANDADVEGDSFTVTNVTQGANGSVQINADGTITYTPNANFFGTDSFMYTVNDGQPTGSASATVTVSVTAQNDAPAAADDVATTDEDTPVTIAVLGNDTDVDGDTLTVTHVFPGPNGTVAMYPDGTLTYT